MSNQQLENEKLQAIATIARLTKINPPPILPQVEEFVGIKKAPTTSAIKLAEKISLRTRNIQLNQNKPSVSYSLSGDNRRSQQYIQSSNAQVQQQKPLFDILDQRNFSLPAGESQKKSQMKRMKEKMQYLEQNSRLQLQQSNLLRQNLHPVYEEQTDSKLRYERHIQNFEELNFPKHLKQPLPNSFQYSPKQSRMLKKNPAVVQQPSKSISQSYDSKVAVLSAANLDTNIPQPDFELGVKQNRKDLNDRGIFSKNRSTLEHTSKHIPASYQTSSLNQNDRTKGGMEANRYTVEAHQQFNIEVDPPQQREHQIISKVENLREQLTFLKQYQQCFENSRVGPGFNLGQTTAASRLVYDKISATANIENLNNPKKNQKSFFLYSQSDTKPRPYQGQGSSTINDTSSNYSQKHTSYPKHFSPDIYTSSKQQTKTIEKNDSYTQLNIGVDSETQSTKGLAYIDKQFQKFDKIKAEADQNLKIISGAQQLSPLIGSSNIDSQQKQYQLIDKLRSQRVSSLDLYLDEEHSNIIGNSNPYLQSQGLAEMSKQNLLGLRAQNQSSDNKPISQIDQSNLNQSCLTEQPSMQVEGKYDNLFLTKEQKRYLNKQQKQMMQIQKITKQRSGRFVPGIFEQNPRNGDHSQSKNDSFIKRSNNEVTSIGRKNLGNPFTQDYKGNPIPENLGLVGSSSNDNILALNNSQLSVYDNTLNGLIVPDYDQSINSISQPRKAKSFRRKIISKLDRGNLNYILEENERQKISPYDGVFNMQVRKLTHRNQYEADRVAPMFPNVKGENLMLMGHQQSMNERETNIQRKLKQIKDQQSYARQMNGQERFKVGGLIKTTNGTLIYSGDEPKNRNKRHQGQGYLDSINPDYTQSLEMSALGYGAITASNSMAELKKMFQVYEQDEPSDQNRGSEATRAEESTTYSQRKTPQRKGRKTIKRSKNVTRTNSPSKEKERAQSRLSPSHHLQSIDEITNFKMQKDNINDYKVDESPNKKNRVQSKKSSYIQNCLKSNNHYTEEKLRSLNWLKKDPSHETLQKNIHQKSDIEHLEKFRQKQEILAKYNHVSKENAQPQGMEDGTYKFVILKGNNSELVRRVMESREHWTELTESSSLFSFKWAPVSRYINFEQLSVHGQRKMCNHIERHDHLTTKDLIYQNMQKYCEQNKLDVFQYLPIQFVFDFSTKNFTNEIDKFCQYFNSIEMIRRGDEGQDQLKEINSLISQNRNFFSELRGKPLNSRKYTLGSEMYNNGNVWLIKPNDFNRGRGVKLFNKLSTLINLIKEFTQTSHSKEIYSLMTNACTTIYQNDRQFQNNLAKKEFKQPPAPVPNIEKQASQPPTEQVVNLSANVKTEVFVVQKYLERPLLIDDRKFDIRLWVLVTHDMKCYLFKEGYIRTSSQKFTLSQESIDQPFIHLTNNAVQQFDQNYGKLEEGNQMSFKQASQILMQQQSKNIDFHKILEDDIVPVIEMTLKCAENKINPNQRKHCMEIFGYDFMIDENLKPWLIEINTNPCLEETSQLLKDYLPRMLDDAFKLTLDVIFPAAPKPKVQLNATPSQGDIDLTTPVSNQPDDCQFKIPGHTDENLWKQIYVMK